MSSSFGGPYVGYLPPLVQTDDSHQRASIIIATTVLFFTALLFVCPRLWVRQHPDHGNSPNANGIAAGSGSMIGLDDWLLVTATVFFVIHAALIFSACTRGLGNTVESLSAKGTETVENLYHASNIFYVLALGISDTSVSWLMVRINSSRAPLATRSLKGIVGFIVLWTVGMVFVMLFACPMGSLAVLSTERCPNWYSKWVALGVGASCFEVATTAVAVWNVWGLNTSFMTKALVVALFGLRLPIIPLFAIQLANFNDGLFNADPTLNITLFVCLSELVLSYNICSANFPAFRRLTNDIRTDFGGFTIGGTSSGLGSSQKYHRGNYIRSKGSARSDRELELDTIPINDSEATMRSGKRVSKGLQTSEWTGRHEDYTVEVTPGNADNRSVSSMAASEHESTEMIIRTRTDVVVRSDSGAF